MEEAVKECTIDSFIDDIVKETDKKSYVAFANQETEKLNKKHDEMRKYFPFAVNTDNSEKERMLYYNNISLMASKFATFDVYFTNILMHINKSERDFTVKYIRDSIERIHRLLVELRKKYYKKTTGQALDVELEMLRINLSKLYAMKYLNANKYVYLTSLVNEIGRILGTWLKLEKKRANTKK